MAKKTDHWILTPEQKLDYAQKLRKFAIRMKSENDILSANLNEWMADNYAKEVKHDKNQ